MSRSSRESGFRNKEKISIYLYVPEMCSKIISSLAKLQRNDLSSFHSLKGDYSRQESSLFCWNDMRYTPHCAHVAFGSGMKKEPAKRKITNRVRDTDRDRSSECTQVTFIGITGLRDVLAIQGSRKGRNGKTSWEASLGTRLATSQLLKEAFRPLISTSTTN